MHVPIDEIGAYIRASKDVLDMLKVMSGMLPKGRQHDDAEMQLAAAEKALQASEVQLAKALDYHLCQCTFPPQIMLRSGRHPNHGDEIFKCSACNNQEPSEHEFRRKDAFSRPIDQSSSWMAR
jgi:hypothetical protein